MKHSPPWSSETLLQDRGLRVCAGRARKSFLRLPVFVVLLCVGAFLYLQLFLPSGTPIFMPTDHWIYMAEAQQILQGGVLYHTIFDYTFPGTQATYALLLVIFGAKLWIPGVILVALGLAAALLTIAISREVCETGNVLLPACLLISLGFLAWHTATHHWFSTLLALCAVLVLLEARTTSRFIAAGALCGLSTWFTQQGGLALIALVLFVLWEERQDAHPWDRALRKALVLAGAFAVTLALAIVYFVWRAGLQSFLSATVVYFCKYVPTYKPYNTYRVYLGYIAHRQWWEAWPQAFLAIAVPLTYVLFAFAYPRRRAALSSAVRKRVVLIAVLGSCLLIGVAPAPSGNRLTFVSAPALILLVWLLNSKETICRIGRRLLWFAVLLCAISVMFTTFRREKVGLNFLKLPTGRAAFLDHIWFQEYRWLGDHTTPGDYFFSGDCAYYYFPLKLRPPSDVLFVTPYDFTRPSQVTGLVSGLRSHKVPYILWQPALEHPPYYSKAEDHLDRVRSLLRSRYKLVKTFPVMRDEMWARDGAPP